MAVKSVNAAPAAKTPFLITSQLGGSSTFHIFLYCVWYAFLIDAASKHISAIKKNTLQNNRFSLFQINCFKKNLILRIIGWIGYQQMRKRIMAQALEPPGLRDFPQQKQRLATIIRTWLTKRRTNAPAP